MAAMIPSRGGPVTEYIAAIDTNSVRHFIDEAIQGGFPLCWKDLSIHLSPIKYEDPCQERHTLRADWTGPVATTLTFPVAAQKSNYGRDLVQIPRIQSVIVLKRTGDIYWSVETRHNLE
ncbi:hypothetical protein J6590_051646 [Homalodisca vitripennis]|nr:hypothetical protein J6590_051646 [Homalodisca vitripennis]